MNMKFSILLFALASCLSFAVAAGGPADQEPVASASRGQEASDALGMVKKAFEPFPGGLLWSEIVRQEDGSPMVDVADDGSVKVKVRISVKASQYREWTKDLMQKLDAVSTTYEDDNVPCVLVNPAMSSSTANSPDVGNLPPEYAAMAAQAAQRGGMGMGYAAPYPVHPLAQMEMEAGNPPSISLRLDELRAPVHGGGRRLTLRVIRPGQDAVWKGKTGDIALRARIYTLDGEKGERVRRFILDAMKSRDSNKAKPDGTAQKRTAPLFVNPSGNGKVVLSVSLYADKAALAQKTVYPSCHRPSREEAQDAEMSGYEMIYPLSVSAVATSRMWQHPDEIVISPFLVSDAVHCYQAWEDWVPVGTLTEADLKRVTDIRTEAFFRP
jgi:hypothetical protein